jgi:ABC-type transporter Mla subunit MlaD
MYRACKNQHTGAIDNFNKANKQLRNFRELLTIPQKANELESKIAANSGNIEYALESFGKDTRQLAAYKATLAQYKLDTPQGVEAFTKRLDEFDQRLSKSHEVMSSLESRMSELDNCMRTLYRIDSERGIEDLASMDELESIEAEAKAEGKEQEREDEYEEKLEKKGRKEDR